MSRPDNRVIAISDNEESPSSKGRWCRITSGEGDFKESATEIYRHICGKDEKAG